MFGLAILAVAGAALSHAGPMGCHVGPQGTSIRSSLACATAWRSESAPVSQSEFDYSTYFLKQNRSHPWDTSEDDTSTQRLDLTQGSCPQIILTSINANTNQATAYCKGKPTSTFLVNLDYLACNQNPRTHFGGPNASASCLADSPPILSPAALVAKAASQKAADELHRAVMRRAKAKIKEIHRKAHEDNKLILAKYEALPPEQLYPAFERARAAAVSNYKATTREVGENCDRDSLNKPVKGRTLDSNSDLDRAGRTCRQMLAEKMMIERYIKLVATPAPTTEQERLAAGIRLRDLATQSNRVYAAYDPDKIKRIARRIKSGEGQDLENSFLAIDEMVKSIAAATKPDPNHTLDSSESPLSFAGLALRQLLFDGLPEKERESLVPNSRTATPTAGQLSYVRRNDFEHYELHNGYVLGGSRMGGIKSGNGVDCSDFITQLTMNNSKVGSAKAPATAELVALARALALGERPPKIDGWPGMNKCFEPVHFERGEAPQPTDIVVKDGHIVMVDAFNAKDGTINTLEAAGVAVNTVKAYERPLYEHSCQRIDQQPIARGDIYIIRLKADCPLIRYDN